MDEVEKYKKLAKLFFEKMILLERDMNALQENLEKSCEKNAIQLSLETIEIIPVREVFEMLELDDDAIGDAMYDRIAELLAKKEKKAIQKGVDQFFEEFIQ